MAAPDPETKFLLLRARLLSLGAEPMDLSNEGNFGIGYRGKIFAFLQSGRLVVKMPLRRVSELLKDGSVQLREPHHSLPVREWVVVAAGREEFWDHFAEEALLYIQNTVLR